MGKQSECTPRARQETMLRRHGRARPGHPRLRTRKTWMPGTRPGMTMGFDTRQITIKKQKRSERRAGGAPPPETRKQWKQWKTMKTNPECTPKVRQETMKKQSEAHTAARNWNFGFVLAVALPAGLGFVLATGDHLVTLGFVLAIAVPVTVGFVLAKCLLARHHPVTVGFVLAKSRSSRPAEWLRFDKLHCRRALASFWQAALLKRLHACSLFVLPQPNRNCKQKMRLTCPANAVH